MKVFPIESVKRKKTKTIYQKFKLRKNLEVILCALGEKYLVGLCLKSLFVYDFITFMRFVKDKHLMT